MDIAIVITAYNRPNALNMLLSSLDKIETNFEVPLIISIDNQGTEEVNNIAKKFNWRHGEKKVIIHENKLGLVNHFIWTGNQTSFYDIIVFLEDDLLVSPHFLSYVTQAYEFYKDDLRVVSASLYNPFINEATGTRFYQIQDGYDNYFLQQPYWGHIWFKHTWKEFAQYLESYTENTQILPPGVKEWTGSFKKKYIQYLIERGRFVVTPRVSLITNNGIPGVHSGNREVFFQCPYMLLDKKYKFANIDDSLSIYDAAMELSTDVIKKLNPCLDKYDFEMDLFGHKCSFAKEYVLTCKPVRNYIMSFSSQMKPLELSVLINAEGDGGLHFAKTSDVIIDKRTYWKYQFNDILKNYPVSIRSSFFFLCYAVKRLFALIRKHINSKISN